MAPLKFEEHIKEKLEQRTMQPNVDAWQKLNDRLDEDNTQKNSKTYWWLGIAASVVGILLVVTIRMTSETESVVPPTIVNTEEVDELLKDEVLIESPETEKDNTDIRIENEESAEGSKLKTKEVPKAKKPSLLKQKIDKEQIKLVPLKTESAVANAEASKVEIEEKVNEIKPLTNEEDAINSVVAAMQKLQAAKDAEINSELDALLSEAQEEIALEKLYKEAIKSMDADALLQGVEEDLDVSFRDKVFKALKDSYKTVKTAVAERNN